VKTTIVFTGRVPSKKNSLRRVQRGNRTFTMASEQYSEWEAEHVAQLKEAQIPALIPPYEIVYRIFAPDKRASDITNKLEGINDSLVKAEILTDDNWFQLKKVEAVFMGIDRKNPRIEVEIKSLDSCSEHLEGKAA